MTGGSFNGAALLLAGESAFGSSSISLASASENGLSSDRFRTGIRVLLLLVLDLPSRDLEVVVDFDFVALGFEVAAKVSGTDFDLAVLGFELTAGFSASAKPARISGASKVM